MLALPLHPHPITGLPFQLNAIYKFVAALDLGCVKTLAGGGEA
jgi:hypothetical protein